MQLLRQTHWVEKARSFSATAYLAVSQQYTKIRRAELTAIGDETKLWPSLLFLVLNQKNQIKCAQKPK